MENLSSNPPSLGVPHEHCYCLTILVNCMEHGKCCMCEQRKAKQQVTWTV